MSRSQEGVSKKKDDIVEAAEVLYGEWITIEDEPPVEDKTPETFLLQKMAFQNFSKECRIMADIILSLPEEMFLLNGMVKKSYLRKAVKRRTGWPVTKIERVQASLEVALKKAS